MDRNVTFRSVSTCPKDAPTWLNNGIKLQCPNDTQGRNLYQCVPNENRSSLVEFCSKGSIGRFEANICPYAVSSGHLDAIDCSTFLYGCPREPYITNEVFKYSACLEINPQKRCYLANENCLNETSRAIPNSTTFNLMTDSSAYILSTDSSNLTSVSPNSTFNLQPGIETASIIAGVVSSSIFLVVILLFLFIFNSKRCQSWNTMKSTEMDVISIERQEEDQERDVVANIKPKERDKVIAEILVKTEPKKNIPDVNETDINAEIEKIKPAVQTTGVKSKPEDSLGNEEEGEWVTSDTDKDVSSDSKDNNAFVGKYSAWETKLSGEQLSFTSIIIMIGFI
ncbi:uncharacterized protein LOC134251982 isoform X2 [Saccostrea cucullata]|uniref:uncharacterized protein LOC134251982 isoform X2 n=1 Tax=Saccostrea cuccullata TaxID=36930 RepID=UPI002ED2B571